MGLLSPYIRSMEGNVHAFWCPGCKQAHAIYVNRPDAPSWTWDGNAEAPTYSPSILVTNGCKSPRHDGGDCWCTYNKEHPEDVSFECGCCHSFVVAGQIQFLSDCTHMLAGLTVPIPPWPVDS